MRAERLAGGFFRHRGLIAVSVGGAVAETALLAWTVPGANALSPQVTALPPLAAYHDLRWLFATSQSWPAFLGILLGLLIARSVVDAALVLLAWPEQEHAPRPRFAAAALSCAVLTLVVWAVLSPVVTLMFGVALVPFSWPFLAAVPILLGTALALSHGGVGRYWWRRLPAASTAGWLLAAFVLLSVVAAVMPHLNVAEYLAVVAVAGLANARAWYGVTASAVRHARAQAPSWHWRAVLWQARQALGRRVSWLPVAPVAAILVLALVVATARLAFTGTVHLGTSTAVAAGGVAIPGPPGAGPAPSGGPGVLAPSGAPGGPGGKGSPQTRGVRGGSSPLAVLIVSGFGSHCCHDADTLQQAEPGKLVRQFSYLGLTRSGKPIAYRKAADLPIQVLGDRMAAQVRWLYAHTHSPVDIVAESEGTLGLYAMLARHPGLPVASVVLLSPIVQPGQVGNAGVPGEALTTLNNLIGQMSPYGAAGARQLIDSVSEYGASYFADVRRYHGLRWLAVLPLADAVTMPLCPYPPNLVVVAAFHGGLLGNPEVRQLIVDFLGGRPDLPSSPRLRTAAQLISAAAAAWRMPYLRSACPPG